MRPSTAKQGTKPWHALAADDAGNALQTSPEGLSQDEADRRMGSYGPNRLRPPPRRGPVLRFLLQFHDILICLLLLSAAVTAALQHWVDTGVILGVVVINAVIGFAQEGKAEKALEAIRGLLSAHATVIREGRRRTLPAAEVVPGDVVVLQSGDKVPADLRLFHVRELRVDESLLTGESVPVAKGTKAVAEQAAVADRFGMAFSGTLVTYGQGTGFVVATGDATELGRISSLLAGVESLQTPLLRQMARFSRVLTAVILAMAAATFALGVLGRGLPASEMFLAAVGLAVAAIPEGLPAILTITLAIGVQRMARRNAIIRRLPAVETLGSVTVICSDKTGTLTRNEMTVRAAVTAGSAWEVSGGGYDPHGAFLLDGREVAPSEAPDLSALLQGALLCNDAALLEDAGGWRIDGDPTEGALVVAAVKAGLDPEREAGGHPRLDAIPFESEHRFMATLHHDHAGHRFVYVKGAPERVLDMCSRERRDGADRALDRKTWAGLAATVAGRGMRLIAVAFGARLDDGPELRFADVEGGLTLLGLLGLDDPPREEAIIAVARCRSAGIRVKMITGDHAATAQAVGEQMGIGVGGRPVTGVELETLSPSELRSVARATDVFARAAPEHKLRLVEALQAEGEVVAMTGDGVNDAPALKRADVGVAMGLKGTEVAKEAAEVVLADDNFASIAHAVEEGRAVYDNLRKAILFILPTNGAEALTVVAAVALGLRLPILPVQILWVNMLTAVTLALSLAFEPTEPDVMERSPRDPKEALLTPLLAWRIGLVSLLGLAGTMGLFLWVEGQGRNVEQARTVAVNTLVFFEIFYLFNSRFLLRSSLSAKGLFGSRAVLWAAALVVGGQLLFTYAPPLQSLFHTARIGACDWLGILAVSVTVFPVVELEKALLRRRRRGRGPLRRNSKGDVS
ncbi:MAG: cation-transporting P-type ATPase [Deltaproteobacteria bacterium]|nr:cation-transporting P-type ATPase [Deltaproteobacteria bacterium]